MQAGKFDIIQKQFDELHASKSSKLFGKTDPYTEPDSYFSIGIGDFLSTCSPDNVDYFIISPGLNIKAQSKKIATFDIFLVAMLSTVGKTFCREFSEVLFKSTLVVMS